MTGTVGDGFYQLKIFTMKQTVHQSFILLAFVCSAGLLFSCELAADLFKCYGEGSTEEFMREHGIGVIHGGANSLRFTPTFSITDAEVDLVVDAVRHALVNGPRKQQSQAD